MRVVFAGTPAFASPALEALVRAGHEVCLVLTQPDRPAGRGLRLTPSPVAATAARLGLPLEKPPTLRGEAAVQMLQSARPQLLVVAAYGLILPQDVLDVPGRGCLNIHASLLPRWRGAAPIQRAILAGDATTGVCIMQMEAGLDTGPVLLEKAIDIDPRDTAGTLTDKLARLGADAIVEALDRLDTLVPAPQDASRATYAAKIGKAEAVIDWSRPAEQIARQVRAFNPAPGAQATLGGTRIKVWEAEARPEGGLAPGTVAQGPTDDLRVGCGSGSLGLLVVQRPGGRRMGPAEFLRGKPWAELSGDKATH